MRSPSLPLPAAGTIAPGAGPGNPVGAEFGFRRGRARKRNGIAQAIQQQRTFEMMIRFVSDWSEWQDLNLRPPRPERGALLLAL